MFVATARSRQLLSDSGAFADWATTTTSSSAAAIRTAGPDDLSLGFNAGPTSGAATTGGNPPHSWSNPNNHRGGGAINYNLPSDMGMVGLRDVFVVAPAASFNHHHHHDGSSGINLGAQDPTNASNAATALGVGMGVGVIPLLTAGHCHNNMDDQDLMNSSRGSKNFWQQQQNQPSSSHHHHHHALQYNFSKKAASILDNANINSNSPPCLLQTGGDGGGGGGVPGNNSSASSGGGTATCQDCGNQAKKDCPHRRCRTCCKSRGYDCSTHLKSTWVPAARRRERQLMGGAAGGSGGAGSTGSSSGAKKPRLISSQTTSHTSTSDTSSSHQDVGFKEALPGQVRAPAVFKCVRVTAVEDGEDEFAYQAVVRINGHVFKGFLYDQGVGEGRDGFPDISELHLGGGNGGRHGGSSSAPIMDPSDVYGGSGGGGGLFGGSSYGNPIH